MQLQVNVRRNLGGHSDPGGRRELPAWREPPYGRSAVERPRRPFWLSRWAGRRPPEGRPPAQRETPSHEEAGSEWSRRSGKVRRVQLHPSRIPVSVEQTLEFKVGPCYGGPCSARKRMAVRGSESPMAVQQAAPPWRIPRAAENRRETAGFPGLTAAKPPRSECPAGHRQPVGGAPASPAPAVLDLRGRNDPLSLFVLIETFWVTILTLEGS
ncbi:hypothetical protein NDU88_003031 [Pleurodeles waltl]|uniref:Uncharacterized protein n=1 Tax=Pleurodeles waltl TaxID=8319 RepID=A0AAV7RFP2_PLEWA|nr:hypothetical protein NDU88_003031 [Pleurodeles waltl]